MTPQFLGMMLDPLGRTEQPGLFGVPARENQRALRLPAGLREFADRARFFHHRDHAAHRILRAIDPRIMMIAADDPLVRQLRAAHPRDHVVGRRELPVELQLQMHLRRPGPEVIRDRKRPAPRVRRHRSAQRLQQRKRIGVRDRHHRNLHQRRRLFARQALGVLGGADVGGERVAGEDGHVEDGAALGAEFGTPGALRIHVTLRVAVVSRIRVDQASDGAAFGGDLRLDAAPRAAVARDHDLAFDVDAAFGEHVVVARHAVVHVDELRGDVAIRRIGVVDRQLLGGLTGRAVLLEDGLDDLRRDLLRRDEFQHADGRCGEEDVVLFDRGLVAPRLEQAGHEFGVRLAVRRSDMMRPGREFREPLLQVVGFQERVVLRFERVFAIGAGGGESDERFRGFLLLRADRRSNAPYRQCKTDYRYTNRTAQRRISMA